LLRLQGFESNNERKKKAIQATRATKEHKSIFSQVLKTRVELWTLVGGIYSPNHQNSRWGGLLSMGAPDSPVRQPHQTTVRVLTVLTVGALTA
jgi:hypothetical protein